jgi:predicted O-methyltransferase YrrM
MNNPLKIDRAYPAPSPHRLPHPHLDHMMKRGRHEWSILYPAWNLLFYSCLGVLKRDKENLIVETGTNRGCSAVVLAQTLVETGLPGKVITFELDEGRIASAKKLFTTCNVAHLVEVVQGDTRQTLPERLGESAVDFAFVDSGHHKPLVMAEVEILYPLVKKAEGTFYFDNTMLGGVKAALDELRSQERGRNIVEFLNVSRNPPGNAIWQP